MSDKATNVIEKAESGAGKHTLSDNAANALTKEGCGQSINAIKDMEAKGNSNAAAALPELKIDGGEPGGGGGKGPRPSGGSCHGEPIPYGSEAPNRPAGSSAAHKG